MTTPTTTTAPDREQLERSLRDFIATLAEADRAPRDTDIQVRRVKRVKA